MAHRHFSVILIVVTGAFGCSRNDRGAPPASSAALLQSTELPARRESPGPALVDAGNPGARMRTVHFSWKPVHGSAREYQMDEAADQHRIVFSGGMIPGRAYPVLIAFHGQPRRGQAPRAYSFPGEVEQVSRAMVVSGAASPHVLVLPTFRFEGKNWPNFELHEFVKRVDQELRMQNVLRAGTYLFGHSGAAGCGGEGLNQVAALEPEASAVGFFDTCIGPGLVRAVQKLTRKKIPTLVMHSVETAGVRPRRAVEYDSDFDFGSVYGAMGLAPSACPSHLPEVPLRSQPYRCAANASGSTRALVVDTGTGERAHNAIVKVAMRYFLEEYLPKE